MRKSRISLGFEKNRVGHSGWREHVNKGKGTEKHEIFSGSPLVGGGEGIWMERQCFVG